MFSSTFHTHDKIASHSGDVGDAPAPTPPILGDTSPPHLNAGVTVTLPELLALRGEAKHLDLALRGKVLATRSGGHLSRFRGRGMEFDESRLYQPGDDIRNMDWRVTARAGKPHVKLFREERERPVWLMVDLGPTMRFGTRVAFKSVLAAKTAALLAWAAADRGDRVGGLVFDETRHYELRPAARTHGLLPLLQALTTAPMMAQHATFKQVADAKFKQVANAGYTGVKDAVSHLQQLVRPGNLVFILSDFAQLDDNSAIWLANLSRVCELVWMHFYDPIEQMAPPPGLYPVTDGIRSCSVSTKGASDRIWWQQRFRAKLVFLENLTHRYQVHLLNIATNAILGETLASGLRPRGGSHYHSSHSNKSQTL